MPRKGLSKEYLVEAAMQYIAAHGYHAFSMHNLAKEIGVKTSSLYNHTEGVTSLLASVGEKVIEELNGNLQEAAQGKSGKEALLAVAMAYREYAKKQPELYQMTLLIPEINNDELTAKSKILVAGLYHLLDDYRLSKEEQTHFARIFRSSMHGFVSLEQAGYFQCNYPAKKSYITMVEELFLGLERKGN
ncbi:MAG: hypothetical protein PWP24_816 [Clostridiales bacterium]|nr:hypothetical protein [Clostridiales bacterium]